MATTHLGLPITTDEQTLFSVWRSLINGDGSDSAFAKIDSFAGGVLASLLEKVPTSRLIAGLDLDVNITASDLTAALNTATTSSKGLLSASDKVHLDTLVALLENEDGNTIVDTIGEILKVFEDYPEGVNLLNLISGKVDKVAGKGLSTEDYTTAEKSKLTGIQSGAQVNVKPDWNAASGNAAEILNKPTIDQLLGSLSTLGFVKRTGTNTYVIDTSTYQPLDDDLTAIAGLSGTSGFLKKTGSNTWSLETSVYLTEITKIQVEAVLTGTITTHTHNASDIIEDATHRFVTDTEKSTWNNKQDALGFTPEDQANKKTTLTDSDVDFPTTKAVKTAIDTAVSQTLNPIGNWNASTNTPTLTNGDTSKANQVYYVNVAGTQFGITFDVGDELVYNANGVIFKRDNVDAVISVNGKEGVVVLTQDDIGDGSTYKRVTETEKTTWNNKVDKVAGKELSENDYTDADKAKVDLIDTSGDGTKYLADDGTYKTVGGGGGSTLPTITQLEIDAGTSTTPVAITPKLLRDNFYTESEIDNMIGDIESVLDTILGV